MPQPRGRRPNRPGPFAWGGPFRSSIERLLGAAGGELRLDHVAHALIEGRAGLADARPDRIEIGHRDLPEPARRRAVGRRPEPEATGAGPRWPSSPRRCCAWRAA